MSFSDRIDLRAKANAFLWKRSFHASRLGSKDPAAANHLSQVPRLPEGMTSISGTYLASAA